MWNILINAQRNTEVLRPDANISVFLCAYISSTQLFTYHNPQLSLGIGVEFVIDLQIHTGWIECFIYVREFTIYKFIFAYLKHNDYICNGN